MGPLYLHNIFFYSGIFENIHYNLYKTCCKVGLFKIQPLLRPQTRARSTLTAQNSVRLVLYIYVRFSSCADFGWDGVNVLDFCWQGYWYLKNVFIIAEQCQGLFSYSYHPLRVGWGYTRSWKGTQLEQQSPTILRDIPDHMVLCSVYKERGRRRKWGGHLKWWCLSSPFPRDGALLCWGLLDTGLPIGSEFLVLLCLQEGLLFYRLNCS